MDKNILMEMTDNRQWLAAIRTDDHAYVSKILDTSSRLDREKLLHGKSEISATNRSDESKEPETRFERPFILALVSGSVKVFQVMMRYDVDVCLVEAESYNVIHCLVYVAFYQPRNEEAVVNTYRSLCRTLSKEVIGKLLHMEESHGLRPLEFAAQQGTLQLMSAIFETPKVYIVREEIVGISVYQWYDVTEYVAIETKDNRHSLSPLNFLSMLDEKVFDRSSTKDILLNGVLFDWVKLELYCRHSLFIAYNLYRLLYFVAVVVYEMDSFWLERFGSILTAMSENKTL